MSRFGVFAPCSLVEQVFDDDDDNMLKDFNSNIVLLQFIGLHMTFA